MKAGAIPKAKGPALYDSAREKGIITNEEHALLARAEELRAAAIAVDDFSQKEYREHSSPGVLGQVNARDEAVVA